MGLGEGWAAIMCLCVFVLEAHLLLLPPCPGLPEGSVLGCVISTGKGGRAIIHMGKATIPPNAAFCGQLPGEAPNLGSWGHMAVWG